MKIGVYPISSPLHKGYDLAKKTRQLIEAIDDNLDGHIELTTLDNEEYDLKLILIQSGGSEGVFLKKYKKINPPYLLLAYDYNNSLAASMEILSYLKNNHLDGEILYGSSKQIARRIKEIYNLENGLLKIKKASLGIIGKPSDWLIASDVDKEKCLTKFNINLVDIPIEELINNYSIDNQNNNVNKYAFDQKEINKSLNVYETLQVIIKKYNLNGLTVRCFDLLNTIKTTSCLAFSLLNDKRIIATCEGDVPSMLSMFLLKSLLGEPSFQANPSRIDTEEKTVVFAHCTVPLKMTKSYSLDTHFESNIGVAIRGELKESEVTIFKLSNDLEHYYISCGKIIANLQEDNLCRTQIKIKLDDVNYFLKNPYGNHHIIIYGNHVDLINEFMRRF